jgi:hypothetical protein
MAYLRYSPSCEWYVFEQADGTLAVWHQEHRRSSASFTAAEVRDMLAAKSFARVPGFESRHQEQLEQSFLAWLAELEPDAG